MKTMLKTIAGGIAGLFALGASAAFAYQPDYCADDHDHRSHAANYYDYYDADKYYRAGPYRDSGVSFSITIGNDGYYDRSYDRRYDRRASYNKRSRRGRIVNRQVYDTRYRARIVLTEEVVRGRRGHRRLVCTVKARGPEARYVSERRMHRIARRECSPRARVRVLA